MTSTAFGETGSFADQSKSILANSTVQSLISGAEAKYHATLKSLSIDDGIDQAVLGMHSYNVHLLFQNPNSEVNCAIAIAIPMKATLPMSLSSEDGSESLEVGQYCRQTTTMKSSGTWGS